MILFLDFNRNRKKSFLIEQKYNDFVEVATEAIMEYAKEVGGRHMWDNDEVEEIVIAQV